jgi:hypothetical protein
MNQSINPNKLKAVELPDPGGWLYSPTTLEEMNWKFVRAMAAAIRAGLERPPRVGIDPLPGTKNPSFVPYGATSEL